MSDYHTWLSRIRPPTLHLRNLLTIPRAVVIVEPQEDGTLRPVRPAANRGTIPAAYSPQILGVGNDQLLNPPEGATHAVVRVVSGSARLGLLDASVAPEVGPGGGMDDLRGALLTAFRVDVLTGQVRVDYWRVD